MNVPVNVPVNVSVIASLLSDASRSAMLTHLLDGRFHPAGEMALAAGITPQTASFHLAKMMESGVVVAEKHGRHRYYRIQKSADAEIIEQLLSLSGPVQITSLRQSVQMEKLRHARMCYDHVAGELGVSIADSLTERGLLYKNGMEFAVTEAGESFFNDFGLELGELRKKRRSFCRCCLDWTERKHHMAGALGQALAERMMQLNWLERDSSSRAVRITEEGRERISALFDIPL
ncbi:winged helix-turn-helix domain-containing protein [Paenibacillus profundus]|uniref:Winged helix-turn-helix domain-containing protein n=1 Tax=Paenibacillus profundus TaxID=1173085 RepID=A0ABS8YEF6_9BACL|nr:winged helix-turn-helix domain-containing protein [Paenibacillus profundus]MCE5168726.1 winged helix-turn-helix domain-containing protein [Paenibacillus profundus]